jgi:CPA1 family monovalent cation:H+ antiporter
LVTLVGGGLTLPSLVAALRIEGDNEERDEVRSALTRSFDAALTRIAELEREGRIDAVHARSLRGQFEHRRELQQKGDDAANADHVARHGAVEREILAAQRLAVIEMRERGDIDNVVMRKVLTGLDMTAASRPVP